MFLPQLGFNLLKMSKPIIFSPKPFCIYNQFYPASTVLIPGKLKKCPIFRLIYQFPKKVCFLSGGNQQKTIVARWLNTNADIIIMDEPTRGIDVGAKREIYEIINSLVEAGKAIIVISSEMEEIMGICDRIIVIHEGEIAGEVERDSFSQKVISEYSIGGMRL